MRKPDNLWWVDPELWVGSFERLHGKPDWQAFNNLRWQAGRERAAACQMILGLERWYIANHPEMDVLTRLKAIGARVGMSYHQVNEAIKEGLDYELSIDY